MGGPSGPNGTVAVVASKALNLAPTLSCNSPGAGDRGGACRAPQISQCFSKGALPAPALPRPGGDKGACVTCGGLGSVSPPAGPHRRNAEPPRCAVAGRRTNKHSAPGGVVIATQTGVGPGPGPGVSLLARELPARSSVSPGALFFTANWTFRSERNNYSPRRTGLAVNADMTRNVTLPVKRVPTPKLGSRPTPCFSLIMEVTSL